MAWPVAVLGALRTPRIGGDGVALDPPGQNLVVMTWHKNLWQAFSDAEKKIPLLKKEEEKPPLQFVE